MVWRIANPYCTSNYQSFEAWRLGYEEGKRQAARKAEPVAADYPHEQMDALALAHYKVVPSDQSMFWRHAVVAGDGQRHLYNGSEVDCQNMARKFAGAFLDGAFAFHSRFTAPQAQPADALDAARWRALLACGRIRLFGTAGVNGSGVHDPSQLDTYKNPYGNYVHFGAEFWSTFPDQDYYNTKENPAYARATLTEFADACRAAMAADQEGGNAAKGE